MDVLRERKDLMDVVPYADTTNGTKEKNETTNVWFNQPSYKFPTNH